MQLSCPIVPECLVIKKNTNWPSSLCRYIIRELFIIFKIGKDNMVLEAVQGCDLNATVIGSMPTRGNELLFLNIFISSLWYQDKSPEKIGGKWETECLNTRFPLPTLMYATLMDTAGS